MRLSPGKSRSACNTAQPSPNATLSFIPEVNKLLCPKECSGHLAFTAIAYPSAAKASCPFLECGAASND
jgi:hypothetical protein